MQNGYLIKKYMEKRNWFLKLVLLKFKKGGENVQEDIPNNANGEFAYTVCDYLSHQKENTNTI